MKDSLAENSNDLAATSSNKQHAVKSDRQLLQQGHVPAKMTMSKPDSECVSNLISHTQGDHRLQADPEGTRRRGRHPSI